MSSDRELLEAEAEALFLGVGLAPQTAKCATFPNFPLPRSPYAMAAICRAPSMHAMRKHARLLCGVNVAEIYVHVIACRNSLKSPKFRQALVDIIRAAGAGNGAPKGQGALLYQLAGKVYCSFPPFRSPSHVLF